MTFLPRSRPCCREPTFTAGTPRYEHSRIATLELPTIAVAPHSTIGDVAAIMDAAGVGAVAVVDDGELIGVVTDRDLVRRGLARRLELDARVDGLMSSPAVTIDADADAHDAFRRLREHAVRRLAVVAEGRFVGMVTVDDLLIDLAADLADLARPVTAEVVAVRVEHADQPPELVLVGGAQVARVGVRRGDPQRTALARATDDDRDPRCRPRVARGLRQ